MSFSADVKNELFNFYENNRHCSLAELSAYLSLNGCVKKLNKGYILRIASENYNLMIKCAKLLKFVFDVNMEFGVKTLFLSKKRLRIYSIYLYNYNSVKDILISAGLFNNYGLFEPKINNIVVSAVCCKRAYIRGAFLCIGSLCNPEKTYHLEFVTGNSNYANQLKNIINSFEIDSKVIKRKKHFVVYIKEGEQIVDLLNVMSAHKSLLDLENVRIIKGVRNNINRIVNCETANLNKIVSASIKQQKDIKYIKDTVGLSYLSNPLREVAELRLNYPDLSLKELGETLNPPVGKSGINHRLKKISNIAEKLRRI